MASTFARDCFYIDHPVSWAGLAAWCDLMAEAHGDALLRVKGIIEIAETGKPVVVHGVHKVFDRPFAWTVAERRSAIAPGRDQPRPATSA